MSSTLMKQVEVVSTVCTGVGIAVTVTRLFVRKNKHGVDDVYALLSMLCLAAQMAVLLSSEAITNRFTRFYLFMGTFYATIWFARLSILFSITRIARSSRAREFLSFVVLIFLTLLATLIAQAFWVCEPQRWSQARYCKPYKQIAIFQLASDVFADFILLVVPVRLFLLIQERPLRYRLMLLFSTCIITTAVSLVHAAMFLSSQGPKTMIAAIVETAVSLIVASVPILSSVFLQFAERVEARTNSTNASLADIPLPVRFARQSAAVISNLSIMLEAPQRPGTAHTTSSAQAGSHYNPSLKSSQLAT